MPQKSRRRGETRWRSVRSSRCSPTATAPSALSVGHVAVDRLAVLADTAGAQPATPPPQARRNHHHRRGFITEPNLFRVELVRQRGALGRRFGILFVGPAHHAPCPSGRSGARGSTADSCARVRAHARVVLLCAAPRVRPLAPSRFPPRVGCCCCGLRGDRRGRSWQGPALRRVLVRPWRISQMAMGWWKRTLLRKAPAAFVLVVRGLRSDESER